MYIISACLMGQNCKYNGGNNECQWVIEFSKAHDCVFVCPESEGKLQTPRPPSEITCGRAIDKDGRDITEALKEGARRSWDKAQTAAGKAGQKIEGAILKANSPSCGSGKIYDGTFTGTLVEGDGFFSQLLKEQGVMIVSEKESME